MGLQEWDKDKDIIFSGGAATILAEFDDLVEECSSSSSDADALKVFNDYVEKNK